MEARIVVHLDGSPITKESREIRDELNKSIKLEPKNDDVKMVQGRLIGYRKEITKTRKDIEELSKTRFTTDDLKNRIEETTDVITRLTEKKKEYEQAMRASVIPSGRGSPEDYAQKVQIATLKLEEAKKQLKDFETLKAKAEATKSGSVIGYDLSKAKEQLAHLAEYTEKSRKSNDEFRAGQEAAKLAIRENARLEKELANNAAQAAKNAGELHDKGSVAPSMEPEANAANDFAQNLGNASAQAEILHEKIESVDEGAKSTSVDTEDISNNFDKAQKAAEDFQTTLNNIDLNANVFEMDPSELDPYTQALKSLLKQLRGTDITGKEDVFNQIYDQLIRCGRAASEYKHNLDKVEEVTENLEPPNLDADVTKMNVAELKKYEIQLKAVKKEIESENMPKEREGEYQKVVDQLERAKRVLADYRKNLDRVEEAVKEIPPLDLKADVAKMNIFELRRYIQQLSATIKGIETQGMPVERATEYQQATDQLIRAQRAAADYKKNLDKVAEATKEIPPIDLNVDVTKMNIAELVRYMQQLKDKQKEIESAGMPEERDSEYVRVTEQIIRTQRAINDYKKSLDGVRQKQDESANSGSNFSMIIGGIRDAFSRLRSEGSSALSGIRKAFNRVTGAVSKFKSNMSKGFNNLTRTVHKLRSSINKLSNSMNRSFKHGFTNLVKYVFGFRSLFFLVRRVRKYIKEGMDNLAHYNDKVNKNVKSHNLFNDAMNELMTSLNYLKNAWGAAFSPLIISVMPALTALIDKLAVAGNYVAYFIATLTGQATAYNALKTAVDDYADSLDKSGSSAKKNSDKQDELNEKLAEYDKLLVIKQDKDKTSTPNGGSGGSNADAVDYSKMFTTIKADDNLAGALREALEKSDFTTVGNIVRDKIVAALTSIEWNDVKQKASSFGTNLGEFIVGFFDPDAKGNSIAKEVGKALGNAFVTGNVFLNALLTELKKHDWGKDISDAIKSFLTTGLQDTGNGKSGFKLAGENFKGIVTLIIDTFCSAIMNFPTDSFITAITDFITGALGPDNTGAQNIATKMGTALGKLFTDGTKIVNAIVTELKKYKWGSNLADGFKSFLEKGLEKDPTTGKSGWELSGETLHKIVTGIVDGICDFVKKFPYDEFETAIGDWIKGFKPMQTLGTIAKGTILIGMGVLKLGVGAIKALADDISDEMLNQTIEIKKSTFTGPDGEDIELELKPFVDWTEHPLLAWADSILTDAGEFTVQMVFGIKSLEETITFANNLESTLKTIKDYLTVIRALLGDPLAIYEWAKGISESDNLFKRIFKDKEGFLKSGLGGGGGYGFRYSQGGKDIIGDMTPENSEIMLLESAWKKVSDAITTPLTTIKEGIYGKDEGTGKNKKHIKGLIDYWNELKSTIGAPFSVPLDKIKSALFDEKTGIMQYFVGNGSIIQKIKDKLGLGSDNKIGIVGALGKAFTNPLGTIKSALFDEKTGIMQYFVGNKGIVQKIKDKLGLGSNNTIGIVGALKNAFTNPLGSIKTSLFDEKSGLMQYFVGNNSIIKKIQDKMSGLNLGQYLDFSKMFQLPRTVDKMLSESQKSIWEKLFGYKYKNKHINGIFDDIKDKFVDTFEAIQKGLKSPISTIVDMVGGLVNGVINGINTMCKDLVQVKLPGGNYLFPGKYTPINTWDVNAFKKKYGLAQGAVIPPNKEFLAVLGDQKHGTNIETPLDTMVDAFKIALAEGGGTNHEPIMLQLDGRTVAQVVWNEEEKKYKQTGFGLAY